MTTIRTRIRDLAVFASTLPAGGIKIVVPGATGAVELCAMTVTVLDTLEIDAPRPQGGLLTLWIAQRRVGERIALHAVRRKLAIGDDLLGADVSTPPAAATILRALPGTHRFRAWLHSPTTEDAEALSPLLPGLDLSLCTGDQWTPEALCTDLADAGCMPEPRARARILADAEIVALVRRWLTGLNQSRGQLFAAAFWKSGRDSTTRDRLLMHASSQVSKQQQTDLSDLESHTELELSGDPGSSKDVL